jgi:hypothetical protein
MPGAFVKNSFYNFYYIFYSLIMDTSKRKKLTIAEKVKIIQEVEKNPSMPAIEIARKFNLAPSSLFCITLGEAVQAPEVVRTSFDVDSTTISKVNSLE